MPRRLKAALAGERTSPPDPVREFIRAFNERDLDAFVEVLDPEVEMHSMPRLRKGVEAARLWATRRAGRGPADDRARAALRGRHRGWRRRAVALIVRRWHWEEDGTGERGRDGLVLRAARPPDPQLAPYEDRAEALRVGGFATHRAE